MGVVVPQTPEIRIRLHYRALKKRWDFGHYNKGQMFLWLAHQWRRPVQEIKRIVRGEK